MRRGIPQVGRTTLTLFDRGHGLVRPTRSSWARWALGQRHLIPSWAPAGRPQHSLASFLGSSCATIIMQSFPLCNVSNARQHRGRDNVYSIETTAPEIKSKPALLRSFAEVNISV